MGLSRRAPVVFVAGHKGGSGKTTTALALAACLGQKGLLVGLVDATRVQALGLVARDASGRCSWPGVALLAGADAPGADECDLLLVDGPPLAAPEAREVLDRADAVLLTVLLDPLSLRTVPVATATVRRARETNPRLDLLGVVAVCHAPDDDVQALLLSELRASLGALLLEPPVARQREVAEWALRPGSAPPAGPALEAYASIAGALPGRLGLTAARDEAASPKPSLAVPTAPAPTSPKSAAPAAPVAPTAVPASAGGPIPETRRTARSEIAAHASQGSASGAVERAARPTERLRVAAAPPAPAPSSPRAEPPRFQVLIEPPRRGPVSRFFRRLAGLGD